MSEIKDVWGDDVDISCEHRQVFMRCKEKFTGTLHIFNPKAARDLAMVLLDAADEAER